MVGLGPAKTQQRVIPMVLRRLDVQTQLVPLVALNQRVDQIQTQYSQCHASGSRNDIVNRLQDWPGKDEWGNFNGIDRHDLLRNGIHARSACCTQGNKPTQK